MRGKAETTQTSVEQEVRRLMEVLRTLARLLGYSNREIERRGNLPHATALRVFQGHSEPRLEFVLAAVKAMGLEYAEFFDFAYEHPRQPTESALKVRRMLGHLNPGRQGRRGAQEEGPLPGAELDSMLARVHQEVQEILEQYERKQESAAPPRPARKRA